MRLTGKKVWVHRNFQKKCYSVKYKGKLVAHCKHVVLEDVEFRIWKGCQAAARKRGQRNVHAFAIGTLKSTERETSCSKQLWYHYKENDSFVVRKTGKPALKAPRAELRTDGAFI